MGMVTILFETGGRKGFEPINDSRPSLCATTWGVFCTIIVKPISD